MTHSDNTYVIEGPRGPLFDGLTWKEVIDLLTDTEAILYDAGGSIVSFPEDQDRVDIRGVEVLVGYAPEDADDDTVPPILRVQIEE